MGINRLGVADVPEVLMAKNDLRGILDIKAALRALCDQTMVVLLSRGPSQRNIGALIVLPCTTLLEARNESHTEAGLAALLNRRNLQIVDAHVVITVPQNRTTKILLARTTGNGMTRVPVRDRGHLVQRIATVLTDPLEEKNSNETRTKITMLRA